MIMDELRKCEFKVAFIPLATVRNLNANTIVRNLTLNLIIFFQSNIDLNLKVSLKLVITLKIDVI